MFYEDAKKFKFQNLNYIMKNFKFKYLSKNKKPYYIAEIGINHNGYLGLAKKNG